MNKGEPPAKRPVQHIWIGTVQHCRLFSRGFPEEPIIANQEVELLGRDGPFHLHWCGPWWLLRESAVMCERIAVWRRMGMVEAESEHDSIKMGNGDGGR